MTTMQLRGSAGTQQGLRQRRLQAAQGIHPVACLVTRLSRRVVAQAGVNGASPAAAAPKTRPAKAPAASPANTPFTNTNRFIVPKHLQQVFTAEWRRREEDMQRHPGFQGLNVIHDGDSFTISSSWASIPDWEAWSLSPECRRSHLPWGIYQWVPKKGEGFPEDFVPFVAFDEPVNAKY
eukprot:GHRR01007443.1.p2 GENE.GHRR01007443.1~~GHRR01007443.1.p2  ORF type:complete len:179 (+),score=41.86 GHRR01007443.1:248-784(+)